MEPMGDMYSGMAELLTVLGGKLRQWKMDMDKFIDQNEFLHDFIGKIIFATTVILTVLLTHILLQLFRCLGYRMSTFYRIPKGAKQESNRIAEKYGFRFIEPNTRCRRLIDQRVQAIFGEFTIIIHLYVKCQQLLDHAYFKVYKQHK